MALPALYISHGSPRLIIEDSAARDFRNWARTLAPSFYACRLEADHLILYARKRRKKSFDAPLLKNGPH